MACVTVFSLALALVRQELSAIYPSALHLDNDIEIWCELTDLVISKRAMAIVFIIYFGKIRKKEGYPK